MLVLELTLDCFRTPLLKSILISRECTTLCGFSFRLCLQKTGPFILTLQVWRNPYFKKVNICSSIYLFLDDELPRVVSANTLLLPVLLPRLYPSLFTLYVLHNQKQDDLYWDRLQKWNRQSDLALMNFLGVDAKFFIEENANGNHFSGICFINNFPASNVFKIL